MSTPLDDAARRRGLILDGIGQAAKAARREASDVRLIAISKTRSADEITSLIAAGQIEFGESRVQEAQAKWPALRAAHPGIRLHLIGRLQSNKAPEAVELFDTIHSLDRASLLDTLVSAADKVDRAPSVYVQVNIGEEEQKGGVAIAGLPALLDLLRRSPLPLAGLMAIPPNGFEPGPYFALLAKLAQRHGVEGLSMGMSADYQTAVMLGATAVRVGSALFED
ncbi:MAG: YggS family pyridoxal phosphate-dependent enzyme [Sphingomicrobium sp.]